MYKYWQVYSPYTSNTSLPVTNGGENLLDKSTLESIQPLAADRPTALYELNYFHELTIIAFTQFR